MIYLLYGLDPASTTEEAVSSLGERELAEHNKPNIQVSTVVVHTVILTFTLFVCTYKHVYCMLQSQYLNEAVLTQNFNMVTGGQFQEEMDSWLDNDQMTKASILMCFHSLNSTTFR